jgi:hypothetical protein
MAELTEWQKKHLPVTPTAVKVNGTDESAGMTTKSMGTVTVSAKMDDPNAGEKVRLRVYYSSNNFQTMKHVTSEPVEQTKRAEVRITGLKVNTLYEGRLYAVDSGGHQSHSYNGISFWTNRKPRIELVTPSENTEFDEFITGTSPPESTKILFDWKFIDDDSPNNVDQKAYQIKYRTATGDWKSLPSTGAQTGAAGKETYRIYPAVSLVANTQYYWTVRGQDPQGIWSDWPLPVSFYIRGSSSPPTLISPKGGIGKGVPAGSQTSVRFEWKFRDPDPTNKQTQADIRWRVVGAGGGAPTDEGWFTLFGDGVTPGSAMQWDVSGGYFSPGFQYEWQIRTYDDKQSGIPSGWSDTASFVATVVPGSLNTEPPVEEEVDPLGALGCGHHRVFIYDRGGQVLRGEIKPIANVQWNRKRDDISNCLVTTNGFDQDCCVMLGNLQSWVHELVVYRDQTRVFEGPVTRITYTSDNVEIEAKDVMGYLYRRVMRQGYNDRYRRVDLTPISPPQPVGKPGGGPYTITGQNTVVDRALQITLDALAYKDPNVLPYVTAIRYADDATEQRAVADFQKTAWEEIDDLAATAGLDYVTIGRRILYWDTHRAIGRLPEMRDGDFSDPVIVTEYGMQTANWFAVTNNNGIAGIVYPAGHDADTWAERYGPVEMVSSAYGEQEGEAVATEAITPAEKAALVETLQKQARTGISNRWPTPVVVRVPDNSTLNPQINLGINQLIPGVWIPLRSTLTCRQLAQWQKLDEVNVEESEGVESIKVTMSPAPHGGNDDPDLSGEADAS